MSPVSQTGPTTSIGARSAPGRRLGDRHDVVPGLVHRRADQVVHAGVEDQEVAALALLDVDDAGEQHAGVAGDQPPGLDLDLAAEVADGAADHLAVVERQRRRLVGAAVGDAEAAAEVEPADGVAVGAQRAGQRGDLAEGGLVGGELGELAADVDVDADDLDARAARAASA